MGFTQVRCGGRSLSIDFFIRCMFIEHQLRHPGKANEQEDPSSRPQGTIVSNREGRVETWRIYFALKIFLFKYSGSVVKNSPANVGDKGSVPGSGRSPGERNGNPLQCSYLGNLMDRGAWQATVRGVTESDTT